MSIIKERSNGILRVSNKSFDEYMLLRFGMEYKVYRDMWENPKNLSYPVQINLEINDLCNLRCKMCPRSTDLYNLNTGQVMSFMLFKKIIDNGNVKAVAFGGGDEPLLNSNLPRFIKYASIMGVIDIRVTTNGTMLNWETSKQLIKNGVTWLSVSMDAFSKEKYQLIRKGSDYNLVENNIRGFIRLKKSLHVNLPILRLSIINMDVTKDEIKPFLNKWVNQVDYVDVQRYVNYVDGQGKHFHPVNCLDPFRRLWIRADGDVFPCCNFLCVKKEHDNELLLGNVYKNTVKEIWDGDKLKEIRKCVYYMLNLPRTCRDCMKRWNRVRTGRKNV